MDFIVITMKQNNAGCVETNDLLGPTMHDAAELEHFHSDTQHFHG